MRVLKLLFFLLLLCVLFRVEPAFGLDTPRFEYRLFMNHGLVMLLIDPVSGQIVDVNHAAASYYGYSGEQLRQMKIHQINTLNPSEIEMEMQRAASEKRNYFVFRHRHADGSVHPVEVYSSPITFDGRQLLYSVIVDVTQREALSDAIVENESRMRYAERVASFGYWLLDFEKGFYELSEGAMHVLGVDVSIYPAADLQSFVVEGDRARIVAAHMQAVEENQPYSLNFQFQRPDGTIIDLNSQARYDEVSKRVFGVIKDITLEQASLRALRLRTSLFYAVLGIALVLQLGVILLLVQASRRRKQAEAERERLQGSLLAAAERARIQDQQLQRADRLASLGVMVAGVAHEINNPVHTIMLNADLLLEAFREMIPILERHFAGHEDRMLGGFAFAEMREALPQLLRDIMESCERVKTITTDLSSVSPNHYETAHERTDVNKAIHKAVQYSRHIHKYFKDAVHLDLSEGLPLVPCSSRRLEQVLVNLLQNAWHSLAREDARIFVHTSFGGDGDTVLIRIRDEGCGMEPAVLDRVKDPFFTTRREGKGTGLGVSVSNGIIQSIGGTLDYESKFGEGTTVTILLPAEGR